MIQFHHVQITVPEESLEEAKGFYCEVMGFQNLERPQSLHQLAGLWLAVGNLQLHVRAKPCLDRNLISDHVAYQVEDLEYWRNKISATGLEIKESIPIPGMDRFEFRDPFGNRIEILSLNDV